MHVFAYYLKVIGFQRGQIHWSDGVVMCRSEYNSLNDSCALCGLWHDGVQVTTTSLYVSSVDGKIMALFREWIECCVHRERWPSSKLRVSLMPEDRERAVGRHREAVRDVQSLFSSFVFVSNHLLNVTRWQFLLHSWAWQTHSALKGFNVISNGLWPVDRCAH